MSIKMIVSIKNAENEQIDGQLVQRFCTQLFAFKALAG